MYLKYLGDKKSSRIKELDHSKRTILTTRHHHGVCHDNLQDSFRVSLDDRNAEGSGDVDSMVHLVHKYGAFFCSNSQYGVFVITAANGFLFFLFKDFTVKHS